MTVAPKPNIQVVRVSDEHADALATFFLAAWGDGAPPVAAREALDKHDDRATAIRRAGRALALDPESADAASPDRAGRVRSDRTVKIAPPTTRTKAAISSIASWLPWAVAGTTRSPG